MSDRPGDMASAHRRAWEAIPWVVNGSATAAQRHLLEAHLLGCEDCWLELVRQRELQSAIASEPPPAAASDVDTGLQRLFARIDRASDDGRTAAAPGREPQRATAPSSLTLWLAAAVVVEALALAVLGVGLVARSDPAPGYVTLSGNGAAAQRGATIRIVPAPSLRIEDLQRLLHRLNLQVVAGPSSVGAYDLAPQAERAQPTARALQISTLRAEPGLRLVEPIDPVGAAR